MISRTLRFLGFKQEEIDIYLACLEYGQSSIANIAQITKIGRVNCYHYTEKLVQGGYLSVSQKRKVKTFSAEHPRIFLNREQEKLNLAQELMPELLALSSKNPQKPKIQFFEGINGVKAIFEKFLELRKTEIVSFSHFEKLADFFGEDHFLQQHFEKRVEQGIKTRFISPRTKASDHFISTFYPQDFDQKLLEVFLISSEEFFFESEITIFAGSIAIVNLSRENPIAVLIENPELYRTQKAIFDLAWLGATSFVTG